MLIPYTVFFQCYHSTMKTPQILADKHPSLQFAGKNSKEKIIQTDREKLICPHLNDEFHPNEVELCDENTGESMNIIQNIPFDDGSDCCVFDYANMQWPVSKDLERALMTKKDR